MKMKNFVLILFAGLLFGASALAGDRDAEIDRLIVIFQGTNLPAQKDACNRLQWSGISDTRLFDQIEMNLQNMNPDEWTSPALDLAAYYIRALAASGQEKYRATLQKAEDSDQRKIRKYASVALQNLDRYAVWNEIISKGSDTDPDAIDSKTHFTNMINSEDWELRRMASKRIYFERIGSKDLLDTLNNKLVSIAEEKVSDRLEIDSFNWMMKALAASGDTQYRATLELIAEKGHHNKNRSYATSYIRKYLE